MTVQKPVFFGLRATALRLLGAAALVAITASATSVSAHRQWMLPSVTTISGTEGWVTVDAAISNDLFNPDHFPMPTDGIKVTRPDGSAGEIANAATGRYRSVFDVRIDQSGTWKIWTASDRLGGRFKLDGKDWTVGRGNRANNVATADDIPANATDVQLSENISRNEIFVTSSAPTTTVFKPTGKGLEMEPITHPDDLVADEEAQFRFLLDGRPAANLAVVVAPGDSRFRDAEHAQELQTDKDGVLTIHWPVAGFYWLNASLSDDHPADKRATSRRISYVTTLEVPAP